MKPNLIQKFTRGDVVRVAADLGPSMAHFRADGDAVIEYSYRDRYGGDDVKSYGIMFCDDGYGASWYEEHQLTFIRHGGQQEIDRINLAAEERNKIQTDLGWIVANWKSFGKRIPGSTMAEIMRRVGIRNPWGSNGEGINYYLNARRTFALVDPVMRTGNLEQVEAFFAARP